MVVWGIRISGYINKLTEHAGSFTPACTPLKQYFEVVMKQKIPKPPQHLKAHGRAFWRGVHRDFEISECHDLKILSEAAACIDRIEEARKVIEEQGAYFIDRWKQPKPHPAHGIENQNKILLARLLRELCLDMDPPENRPPARY